MNAASATKVLIVDDDPAMLRLVAKWVEGAGYQVACASEAYQAMEAVKHDCPNILITDWEMPGIDGLELVRWLRAQDLPHYVYIAFLTVRCGVADVVRGVEAGADDFLKKPVDRDELVVRLLSGTRVIRREQELSRLSQHDSLTGLMNRGTFHHRLQSQWDRPGEAAAPLSCVMLDIDYFKRLNDLYGHLAGDQVLGFVASVLSELVPKGGLLCRFGGEEFCVLLPGVDEASACDWASEVGRRLRETPIRLAGQHDVRISASCGIAQRRVGAATPEQLIDRADQAMLVAKQLGRDRCVGYQSICGKERSCSTSRVEPFRKLQARQLMTSVVAGLDESDTIGMAAQFFVRFNVSSAPVVDAEGKLAGILDEKELMAVTLTSDWHNLPIRDVVRGNAVCFEEDTPVMRIYEFLCRVSLQTVVIVAQGKPTGVISRASLLRWLSNASPTMNPATGDSLGADNPMDARDRVQCVARLLADEATQLHDRLQQGGGDLVPALVIGATRMQELVGGLLADSRWLETPAEGTGSPGVQRGVTSVLTHFAVASLDEMVLPESP